MHNSIPKKRLDYLDIVKGFAILLVILGCITEQNNIKIWIYSFHIPLFFIISGILFYYTENKNKTVKRIIKSRIRNLMNPFLFFSFFNILIIFLFFKFPVESVKVDIVHTLTFYGIGSLWFLPALYLHKHICIYKISI